tara:strand:+ start:4342 stop:4629 length:288 start_codon:yes stop_codon:yes gene_type:complete
LFHGKRYNIDTSFRYYFKGRGYSNFQLGLINASLESAALSSLDYYIGTGVYYQFSQGISASINSQYLRANYKKSRKNIAKIIIVIGKIKINTPHP